MRTPIALYFQIKKVLLLEIDDDRLVYIGKYFGIAKFNSCKMSAIGQLAKKWPSEIHVK